MSSSCFVFVLARIRRFYELSTAAADQILQGTGYDIPVYFIMKKIVVRIHSLVVQDLRDIYHRSAYDTYILTRIHITDPKSLRTKRVPSSPAVDHPHAAYSYHTCSSTLSNMMMVNC